ncbi:MAG: NAD(P)-binding protein [Nevskiaceae bacterium]
MNQAITRRDFINGVAVAISGSMAWRWSEARAASSAYPPILTGLRGSHAGSFEVAHALRDGARWEDPADTGERYDLVVVGGGLSGLAAAWYFREARPRSRILILDNHDDFGGHAKRNEFWIGDRMVLAQGGTENIEDLRRYDPAGRRLLRSIGIDVARYPEFQDASVYGSRNMGSSVFLCKESFGRDHLLVGDGKPSWREYFASAPLSETAREQLIALHESDADYLKNLPREEKIGFLQKTSYAKYLQETVGICQEAVAFLWRSTTWATGLDAISTWVAASEGWPGTTGLGVEDAFEAGTVPDEEPLFCQFPDGNATIARLIVRALVPGVAPGNTVDDVVATRFDYGVLDSASARVRVRLNSTVVNVSHQGDPRSAKDVEVTYVLNGRAFRVRGEQCVLACYNASIPYICGELPAEQRTALSQAVRAPLVYTNVLLRNWNSLARLGVGYARCPNSYFETVRLTEPLNIGGYRHSSAPDQPVVLRMVRAPLDPGLRGRPIVEQWRAGRAELLTTTFETFEMKIRDQLARMLGDGGFDASRDIAAITVNRWPHGYAYGHDPESGQVAFMLDELPPERSPWIVARRPFGRIAIANSDAAADAMTEGALQAAHLAIESLLGQVLS